MSRDRLQTTRPPSGGFDALLAANRRYAVSAPRPSDGIAHAGIGVVTCMDPRLRPLPMLGLVSGEAVILRTPGGRVTPDALAGCVLGVSLLEVQKILVITHSRCTLADSEVSQRHRSRKTHDADTEPFARLRADVGRLAGHPLLAGLVEVGGFHFDVDTSLLDRVC